MHFNTTIRYFNSIKPQSESKRRFWNFEKLLNVKLGQVMAVIKKLWALLAFSARLSVIIYVSGNLCSSLVFPLISCIQIQTLRLNSSRVFFPRHFYWWRSANSFFILLKIAYKVAKCSPWLEICSNVCQLLRINLPDPLTCKLFHYKSIFMRIIASADAVCCWFPKHNRIFHSAEICSFANFCSFNLFLLGLFTQHSDSLSHVSREVCSRSWRWKMMRNSANVSQLQLFTVIEGI